MNRTSPRPGTPRGDGGDVGSAAAELALITPVLVLLMLLAVAVGRLVNARLQADGAARQAARAASIARDPATATADASATAKSMLVGHAVTCEHLTVATDTSAFRPGGHVTVHVWCTVSLAGLALLHIPGNRTISAAFTSPIDVFRSATAGTP